MLLKNIKNKFSDDDDIIGFENFDKKLDNNIFVYNWEKYDFKENIFFDYLKNHNNFFLKNVIKIQRFIKSKLKIKKKENYNKNKEIQTELTNEILNQYFEEYGNFYSNFYKNYKKYN